MNIKELFEQAEGGTLTYAQFEALANDSGAKFTDLSEGKYVSKSKYTADLKEKDTEITNLGNEITSRDDKINNLNETISTRDTDLVNLQKQLEDAGQDATKLAELNTQISGLQAKYDADVQAYQNQLKQQAYEFAVKEYAQTKNFSSQAAKRDFVQSMIARNLEMDNGKILGRDDFAEAYFADNADALVPEKKEEPVSEPVVIPEIVAPTPGPTSTANDGGFQFNFTGVRAH